MNRKIKQSSVPLSECNEWGTPNELWEFCGYSKKNNSSMWRRKGSKEDYEKSKKAVIAGLNALIGEEE